MDSRRTTATGLKFAADKPRLRNFLLWRWSMQDIDLVQWAGQLGDGRGLLIAQVLDHTCKFTIACI